MEEHSIREDAVKSPRGQIETQQILLPDFATAVCARHGHEAGCTVETNRLMAPRAKRGQIPPRPTAEIEESKRRRSAHVTEKRLDVLAHVVVFGALPERRG